MDTLNTPTFAKDPAGAVAFYQEYGYVIERNFWSSAEQDALLKAANELPSNRDETYAIAMHPHLVHPTFLNALRNPNMVRNMELVLGGRISGIQTQYFFCKPGTPGFLRHQDNFYVQAKNDCFASVWSPLVDVSPVNGTLVIYPGSHKEPVLPVEVVSGDDTLDKNALRHQAVIPEKYKPVDVCISAGDAVFFHGHLVHESHMNRSNGFRRVLLCTFVRAGEQFRAGFNAQRIAVDVYSTDAPLKAAG